MKMSCSHVCGDILTPSAKTDIMWQLWHITSRGRGLLLATFYTQCNKQIVYDPCGAGVKLYWW